MLGSIVLLFAIGLVAAVPHDKLSPPQWSPVYTVKGIMHLPRSDIQEPFEAWFDSIRGRSRIDYYDGMLRTYQYPPTINGRNGTLLNIVPESTETELNVMSCRQNTKDGTNIQPALPDMSDYDYKYIGTDKLLGIDTMKWQAEAASTTDIQIMEFAVWVVYDTDVNGNELAIPKKYEVTTRDPAKGTIVDHVFIEYSNYSVGELNKDIFDYFCGVRLPCVSDEHVLDPMHAYIPYDNFEYGYPIQHEQAFIEFKEKHGKQYQSEDEHKERMRIFRDNLRFIESHNRAGLGYTLAVNHLADRTDEELRVLHGSRFNPHQLDEGHQFPYSEEQIRELSASIPKEFDWRLHGAVTPVKDQMSCGSCWSFGAVGAVEGAWFLKSGNLVRFSEQALVDCSWGYGNSGCGGGAAFAAYEWIMKHGLPTYEEYGGYLGKDGYCLIRNMTTLASVTNWIEVTSNNEDALRLSIFKHGPVAVSINSSPRTFKFYSHGVYYDRSCKVNELDHAVLAVGYGVLNGQKYWLIKNSWSNLWGNDGYILISTKNNNCGVLRLPTYVVV